MTNQNAATNLHITGSGRKVAGAPSSTYSLPSFLDPTNSGSASTNVLGAQFAGGYQIAGDFDDGSEAPIGTDGFSNQVSTAIAPAIPVAEGHVLAVDPTLVGAGDAAFSMTGASASPSLGLGVKGSLDASLDAGQTTSVNTHTVTTNLDFTGSGRNIAIAPSPSYTLPTFLDPHVSGSTTANVAGVHVSANYNIAAGLSGSFAFSLGTYAFSDPIAIAVTLPTFVAESQVFTVDPTLGALDDNLAALFSMTGPTATATLKLGVTGTFNASFSVPELGTLPISSMFNVGTHLPTSGTFAVGPVSFTVAEPTAFDDAVSGSGGSTLPQLTAKGQGNNILSGSIDLFKLALDLASVAVPAISKLDGNYSFGSLGLSYTALSLPLTAGIAIGQSATITPTGITATATEFIGGKQVGPSQTGALGTDFSFTAPSTGTGQLQIETSYTADFTITTDTYVVSDINLSIDGPQGTVSYPTGSTTFGPLGDENLFDDSYSFPPIDDHTSMVSTELAGATYTVNYLAPGSVTVAANGSTNLPLNGAAGIVLGANSTLNLPANDKATSASSPLGNFVFISGVANFDLPSTSVEYFGADIAGDDGMTAGLNLEGGGQYWFTQSPLYTGQTQILDGSQLYLESGVNVVGDVSIASGGALLDLAGSAAIGSLAGAGIVTDGVNTSNPADYTLTVGADNTATTFSGSFQEEFGFTLSLTTVGTGSLTLNSASLYHGVTTIAGGDLILSGAATALGDVTVNSPGALAIEESAVSIGALSGTGGVVLYDASGATLTIGADNASGEFSGTLDSVGGTGGIVKVGTGVQYLNGRELYSGTTTVNGGALILSGSDTSTAATIVNSLLIINSAGTSSVTGSIASATISVAQGAGVAWAVDDRNDNQYAIDSVISGGGSVVFQGADDAVTTLNEANSYSGGTTILSGIVDVGDNAALGAGTVTMTGGAIRATAGAKTLANAFNMRGVIGLGALTNISGAITLTGNTAVSASENAGGSVWSGAISLGAFTLSTTDTGPNTDGKFWNGTALTISGAISGTGGVTQDSNGALILSGANSYSGGTVVTAGRLEAGAVTEFGAGSVSVAAGATLDLGGFNQTFANVSGKGTYDDSGAAATLTISSATAMEFDGTIENTGGPLSLIVSGPGALTLTGLNTYTGTTLINQGSTLKIGAANPTHAALLGSGAVTDNGTLILDFTGLYLGVAGAFNGSGDVTLEGDTFYVFGAGMSGFAGAINMGSGNMARANTLGAFGNGAVAFSIGADSALDLHGFDESIGTLTGSGAINDSAAAAALTISSATASVFTGTIENSYKGALSLVVAGAGALTLTGANSYAGTTSINQGATLRIGVANGSGASLGLGGVTDNGTLVTYETATIAAVVAGSGQLDVGAGALTLTGANSYIGTTLINHGSSLQIGDDQSSSASLGAGAITVNGALIYDVAGGVAYNDIITNAITGSGALTLEGGQRYYTGAGMAGFSGAINIAGNSRLSAGAVGAFGNGAVAVSVGANAVLDLNSLDESIGALTGSGTVNDGGGAATLTISSATASVFGGTIEDTGGQLALTIAGSGALTLTGANSYAGPTVINQGSTLQIGVENGSGASFGAGGFTNNGTLVVDESGTIAALAGAGQVDIGAGVDLTIDGVGFGSRPTFIFTGEGGALTVVGGAFLADDDFLPTLNGFGASDAIDVQVSGTSVSYSDDVLTLLNGAASVATFNINGDYSGDTFEAIVLSPNETQIIVRPPPPVVNVPGTQSVSAGYVAELRGFSIADSAPNTSLSVTLGDSAGMLSATAAVAGGGGTIGGAGTNQLTISGTLAQINADLSTLTYESTVVGDDTIAVSASDGLGAVTNSSVTVHAVESLTVKQYLANIAAADQMPNGFAIHDTATNVQAGLASLAADAHITTITATGGKLTETIATFTADEKALDRVIGGFAITDMTSHVQAGLARLEADRHVTTITATDGTLTETIATFTADKTALDKVVGGFAISDSAGNVVPKLPRLNADARIASLAITSGTGTLGAGAVVKAPTFAESGVGTTLTVRENLTYGGSFNQGAGATVTVSSGHTLSLSGASSLDGRVNGGGALTLTGGSTTIASGAKVGVADWSMKTKANATLNGNLFYAGAFTEAEGASIDLSSAGRLTVMNTTTIDGTVTGAGVLIMRNGAATIGGSALLSMTRWIISGATAMLGTAVNFAGSLAMESGATIDGSQALTTSGVTSVDDVTIGGTVSWTNKKTIAENGGGLVLGDSSGSAARLINAKSGIFDLLDDNGIMLGESAASSISNMGLIEKTTGTGADSQIAPNITNAGLILVTSGTLDLQGTVGGTGSDQVGAGATLELDGSVGVGQTVKYATTGGEVSLDDLHAAGVQLFHGTLSGWGTGDSLDVGTAFGTGTHFKFVENGGDASGVLHLTDGAAHAAIAFAGDFSTSNFTPSVNSSGATVFTFHA